MLSSSAPSARQWSTVPSMPTFIVGKFPFSRQECRGLVVAAPLRMLPIYRFREVSGFEPSCLFLSVVPTSLKKGFLLNSVY